MSSSHSSDLSTPLLETGVLYDVGIHGDEETGAHAVEPSPCQENDNDNTVTTPSDMTWFDCLIIWTVLPGLLWIDFSMALFIQSSEKDDDVDTTILTSLSARLVQLSIVLFILASYMYRKTIQEMRVNHVLLVLLPEILMDLVLLLILFDRLLWAFRALLWSILALSLVVMVYNVKALCTAVESEGADGIRHAKNSKPSTDSLWIV